MKQFNNAIFQFGGLHAMLRQFFFVFEFNNPHYNMKYNPAAINYAMFCFFARIESPKSMEIMPCRQTMHKMHGAVKKKHNHSTNLHFSKICDIC